MAKRLVLVRRKPENEAPNYVDYGRPNKQGRLACFLGARCAYILANDGSVVATRLDGVPRTVLKESVFEIREVRKGSEASSTRNLKSFGSFRVATKADGSVVAAFSFVGSKRILITSIPEDVLHVASQVYILGSHATQVTASAADSDRGFLASGSADGVVKVWSLESGEEVAAAQQIVSSSTRHAVTALAFGLGGYLIGGFEDGAIHVWDDNHEDGDLQRKLSLELPIGAMPVTSISTCEHVTDDRVVWLLACGAADGSVYVWESDQLDVSSAWAVVFSHQYPRSAPIPHLHFEASQIAGKAPSLLVCAFNTQTEAAVFKYAACGTYRCLAVAKLDAPALGCVSTPSRRHVYVCSQKAKVLKVKIESTGPSRGRRSEGTSELLPSPDSHNSADNASDANGEDESAVVSPAPEIEDFDDGGKANDERMFADTERALSEKLASSRKGKTSAEPQDGLNENQGITPVPRKTPQDIHDLIAKLRSFRHVSDADATSPEPRPVPSSVSSPHAISGDAKRAEAKEAAIGAEREADERTTTPHLGEEDSNALVANRVTYSNPRAHGVTSAISNGGPGVDAGKPPKKKKKKKKKSRRGVESGGVEAVAPLPESRLAGIDNEFAHPQLHSTALLEMEIEGIATRTFDEEKELIEKCKAEAVTHAISHITSAVPHKVALYQDLLPIQDTVERKVQRKVPKQVDKKWKETLKVKPEMADCWSPSSRVKQICDYSVVVDDFLDFQFQ